MEEQKSKIKLLIVDDEVKFLQSISERLKLKDFEVTTASDGSQAVKVAKREKFDVAILDLKMPDMDGTEVMRILKKRHKFLQILILTGHASIDSAVECTKLGAFNYIEKPYDFDNTSTSNLKDPLNFHLRLNHLLHHLFFIILIKTNTYPTIRAELSWHGN